MVENRKERVRERIDEIRDEIDAIRNEETPELQIEDDGVFNNSEWLHAEMNYLVDEYQRLEDTESLQVDINMEDLDMETVMKQQETIRQSGETNMMDMKCVLKIAERSGFDELVEFLERCTPKQYVEMAANATEYDETGYEIKK